MVAVLKQTRVDVVLREPTGVALPGGAEAVDRVRLYADDGADFVAAAHERLAATSAR